MTDKRFTYALIGCGQAGLVHGWHFSRHQDVWPAVCMDTDPTRAERTAKDLGFAAWTTSLDEALGTDGLNLVSIATPPSEHALQIRRAAERRCSILSEKPLFLKPDEAGPTLSLVARQGVALGVMLPRRYYNNSLAVRNLLRENRLGNIHNVAFSLECRKERSYYEGWRGRKTFAGGGVLMSQAIHSIDQLVFFFGKPVSVRGRTRRTREYIDVEDEAEATVIFEGGVTATIRATNNSKDHLWRGLTTIEGERGRIVLDSEKVVAWEVPGVALPQAEEQEPVPETYKPSYYGPGHEKVIRNFIRSLGGEDKARVSAEEAMIALRIIWDIYGV